MLPQAHGFLHDNWRVSRSFRDRVDLPRRKALTGAARCVAAIGAIAAVGVSASWGAAAARAGAPQPTQSDAAAIAIAIANANAIATAMQGRRHVILGEVHDNAALHAIRLEALRALLATGARPALAFEQIDRGRQSQVDRARAERPGDAAHLIAAADRDGGWDWSLYRPFVQLALDHDLPIVAANLSRVDTMRASREGFVPVLGYARTQELGLDRLPRPFLEVHESAIADGHCGLLPATMLPVFARAQVARDIVLSDALRTHPDRGVVLLTGNGHARIDVGIPYWLTPQERAASISIGIVERAATGQAPAATAQTPAPADPPFDVTFTVEAVARPDPCIGLRERFGGGGRR
jgi:uncharacterized iron-regulated protein